MCVYMYTISVIILVVATGVQVNPHTMYVHNMFICVYLFLFCRILAELDFKQIGRHYYNPNKQIRVPQHK